MNPPAWALTLLWRELKLDTLARLFRRKHPEAPIEALLRVMVFNRLCEPTSKLGVLRWPETTRVPAESGMHDRLLVAMDALKDEIEAVEARLAGLIRPLLDTELSVVLYDLTTVSVCAGGEPGDADDLRRYGRSKDGGIARQWLLGLVQTADGIPIAHQVFPGNTAEVPTLLQPLLERLLARYSIRRVIVAHNAVAAATQEPNGTPAWPDYWRRAKRGSRNGRHRTRANCSRVGS